jgi:hypothetical protein
MLALNASIALLRANPSTLTGADMIAAQSILNQHFAGVRPLTDKQVAFLAVLAKRASNGGAASVVRVKTSLGDLAPLMALFDRAKARLKFPSIVMGDAAGASYRLKLAGDKARVPGSVNVTSESGSDWYGRILTTGEFEASPRVATPPALVPALAAFARDPARAAGAHAKATGRCMFCALPIGEGADPRARAVGYGEVCAGNWGLPFPSKATAQRANHALLTG